MGKTLVICERQPIADAISRALGGSFVSEATRFEGREHVITWAGGELAGLADPEHYDRGLETWRLEDLPDHSRALRGRGARRGRAGEGTARGDPISRTATRHRAAGERLRARDERAS